MHILDRPCSRQTGQHWDTKTKGKQVDPEMNKTISRPQQGIEHQLLSCDNQMRVYIRYYFPCF